jgi:LacI family transcriptional regulator/LacI family repressor for deo operon, udp, cdd, tsx, nupC, and nupG
MARRISIMDIAQRAEVSHTTVSRALRDHARISEPVRKRIRALAHEMGYVPNAIAQSLQQQQTRTIGVVVPDMADPFWGEVVKGIDDVCTINEQSLLLHAAAHNASRQLDAITKLHQRRVDGVIVVDSQLTPDDVRYLESRATPTVFINSQRQFESPVFRSVAIDNYTGGVFAAQHLLELGHQKFVYFGSLKRPGSNLQRSLGFIDTLVNRGIHASWIHRRECPADVPDIEGGYALATGLDEPGVSAVFCYNDALALGALAGFRASGMGVPHKISVVGFDDLAMARYSWPPLSTVAQPKELLGQTAMRTLAALIEGDTAADTLLAPHMIARESSSPLLKGFRT